MYLLYLGIWKILIIVYQVGCSKTLIVFPYYRYEPNEFISNEYFNLFCYTNSYLLSYFV